MIFEHAKLLDITGPLQVFSDARGDDGEPAYQITLASTAGGNVTTDTGVAPFPFSRSRAASGSATTSA